MNQLFSPERVRLTLLVSFSALLFCGCQSADSGGSFSGFSNPLAAVPAQSEPPVATLDSDPEPSESSRIAESAEAESPKE